MVSSELTRIVYQPSIIIIVSPSESVSLINGQDDLWLSFCMEPIAPYLHGV